ncbi:MAG: hypothetical protein ACREJB_17985 [Planctomycetaceae bacterium]
MFVNWTGSRGMFANRSVFSLSLADPIFSFAKGTARMTRWFVCSSALLGLTLVAGCGSDAEERLGGSGAPVIWEAHQNLFSPEAFGAIDYSAQMGDLRTAKQVAASPEFKANFDAFEQAELPSEWSDRDAEKKAVVQALRSLIIAAETNATPDDLKAAIEHVKETNTKLAQTEATEG